MTKVTPDPDAIARRELHALWRAAYGEPPAIEAAPGLIAKFLVQCLPPAPPYEVGTNIPAHPGEGRDPDLQASMRIGRAKRP